MEKTPINEYTKDGIHFIVWDGVPSSAKEALVLKSSNEEDIINWTIENGFTEVHKIQQSGGMVMYKVDLEKENE